jgi:exodeoxyribonuclease V gamma subunit
VHLELAGGRTLTGTIPAVGGETVIASSFSRLAPGQRLVAWARLLALSAARPGRAWSAATIARGEDRAAVARIRPLGEDARERRVLALEQLEALLDLWARGMREPLPIFCRTSAAFAAARAAGGDPASAAAGEWESGRYDKEDREPEHRLVLGGVRRLDELLALAPAADEHGPGWDPRASSRLGRLACRLWDGLLEHEELSFG